MKNFVKIHEGARTLPLLLALQRQPELFGVFNERAILPGTPHAGMTDIWLRYNDRRPFDAGERPWTEFNDQHQSVWYPAAERLPEVQPIVQGLMGLVGGEQLGGILITKLPPGGSIGTHVDGGWHASYYDKYCVAIKSEPGTIFGFPDGEMHQRTGDIHWFRNDVPHWVTNQTDDERIVMIVCIRHWKGAAWE